MIAWRWCLIASYQSTAINDCKSKSNASQARPPQRECIKVHAANSLESDTLKCSWQQCDTKEMSAIQRSVLMPRGVFFPRARSMFDDEWENTGCKQSSHNAWSRARELNTMDSFCYELICVIFMCHTTQWSAFLLLWPDEIDVPAPDFPSKLRKRKWNGRPRIRPYAYNETCRGCMQSIRHSVGRRRHTRVSEGVYLHLNILWVASVRISYSNFFQSIRGIWKQVIISDCMATDSLF